MGPTNDLSGEGMNARGSDSAGISVQEVVNQHYADVYRFAFRLSGNHVDAADLTQQTFLSVCRNLHQLKELEKCRSWLFTIVRNAFLKSQRDQKEQILAFESSFDDVLATESVEFDFDEEAVSLALSEMPENYRTPILLYYFEDIGYKEIADVLGVPIGTVMSRLSRGKSYLRSKLSSPDESLDSNTSD